MLVSKLILKNQAICGCCSVTIIAGWPQDGKYSSDVQKLLERGWVALTSAYSWQDLQYARLSIGHGVDLIEAHQTWKRLLALYKKPAGLHQDDITTVDAICDKVAKYVKYWQVPLAFGSPNPVDTMKAHKCILFASGRTLDAGILERVRMRLAFTLH